MSLAASSKSKRGSSCAPRMKHPNAGEVRWLGCLRTPGMMPMERPTASDIRLLSKHYCSVMAKTWFDARARVALTMEALELGDVIVAEDIFP